MRGYFFNAVASSDLEQHPTGYDRVYDAADFASYYAKFFSDGVLTHTGEDSCKVVTSGGKLKLSAGDAIIQGYRVDVSGQGEADELANIANGKAVLRLNLGISARRFEFLVVEAPVRSGDVWDVVLAQISGGTVTDARTVAKFTGRLKNSGGIYVQEDEPLNLDSGNLWIQILSTREVV